MHLLLILLVVIEIVTNKVQCNEADSKDLDAKNSPSAHELAIPERCETNYDAATVLRDELYLFKDKHFWRPRKNQDAFEIRDIFPELPADITHVDTVYETVDKNIWFFIGKEIFVFKGPKFSHKLSLQDLGINQQKYRKIDAIFRWPFNNRTFIFSGDDYWRLDGNFKVDKDYPKEILGTWKDVQGIDTSSAYDDQLYFFKGPHVYRFDSYRMRLNLTSQTKIGSAFMGCIDLAVHPKASVDFTYSQAFNELPEDIDNPEKISKEPNCSHSNKPSIVLKFFIALVSLVTLSLI